MSASEALGPKFALQNVHEKRNSRRARGSDLALGSKCWPQRLVRNPVFSLGEFRRKILALLQSSEEQNGEQVRATSPTVLLFRGPHPSHPFSSF